MFKSPLTCSAREINIIRKKLKERYTKIWREKINLVKQNPATNRNENKLRTYLFLSDNSGKKLLFILEKKGIFITFN
jgi:hypothetical protein